VADRLPRTAEATHSLPAENNPIDDGGSAQSRFAPTAPRPSTLFRQPVEPFAETRTEQVADRTMRPRQRTLAGSPKRPRRTRRRRRASGTGIFRSFPDGPTRGRRQGDSPSALRGENSAQNPSSIRRPFPATPWVAPTRLCRLRGLPGRSHGKPGRSRIHRRRAGW
jgi:hypothetical protein